jgi:hypothetical protein
MLTAYSTVRDLTAGIRIADRRYLILLNSVWVTARPMATRPNFDMTTSVPDTGVRAPRRCLVHVLLGRNHNC